MYASYVVEGTLRMLYVITREEFLSNGLMLRPVVTAQGNRNACGPGGCNDNNDGRNDYS